MSIKGKQNINISLNILRTFFMEKEINTWLCTLEFHIKTTRIFSLAKHVTISEINTIQPFIYILYVFSRWRQVACLDRSQQKKTWVFSKVKPYLEFKINWQKWELNCNVSYITILLLAERSRSKAHSKIVDFLDYF